jgi:hypothetical protein
MRGVVVWWVLAWTLGCAEPATPQAPTSAHSSLIAANVEDSAQSSIETSASAVELAESAPLPPAIEPEAPTLAPAATPAPDVTVTALGQFDVTRLAKTKLALIQFFDAALRAGDAARLGEVFLDARAVTSQCPAEQAGTTLVDTVERDRQRAADAFAECLALVDWSNARPLVLNYGSKLLGADERCPAWRRHESSELFFAVGDEVYKVKLNGAWATPRGHALGGSIRCSKKPGSADEMLRLSRRFGKPCPGQPWPVLTQVRGPCPRLK